MKIESINGFSIGDAVRIITGDGRIHLIKSFEIDGLKELFCEVHFEDGDAAMINNIRHISQTTNNMISDRERIRREIQRRIQKYKDNSSILTSELSDLLNFVDNLDKRKMAEEERKIHQMVWDKVSSILYHRFNIIVFFPKSKLKENLHFDEFDIIDLCMGLEEDLDIQFNNLEVKQFVTVEDLIQGTIAKLIVQ